MIVVSTIQELNLLLFQYKISGKTIGFVPTMGALHQGHISLITTSKDTCDITVCSIFVNPTQFNNPEDLLKYPRTIENDTEMLTSIGCDILFFPEINELYPSKCDLNFNFGTLENVLEGAFRPGHFNGVGLIVSKLFNIVQPHHAFFGQKDLQQFLIIKRLVNDLSFPITLHCCEIIREIDGLAMSSRNVRLTKEQRILAPKIYESLLLAQSLTNSSLSAENIYKEIELFYSKTEIKLEYFKFVSLDNLTEIKQFSPNSTVAICVACYIDEIRLIDNIIFNV